MNSSRLAALLAAIGAVLLSPGHAFSQCKNAPDPFSQTADTIQTLSPLGLDRDAVEEVKAKNKYAPGATPPDNVKKMKKMASSAFYFMRGSSHLYWKDVTGSAPIQSVLAQFGGDAATTAWIEGDAHPENQGLYNNAEGRLIYNLDDYDDGFIGDYQYDLWRLSTGAGILAAQLGHVDPDELTENLARSYACVVYAQAGRKPPEACETVNSEPWTVESARSRLKRFVQAQPADYEGAREALFAYWTTVVGGKRQLQRVGDEFPDSELEDIPPETEAKVLEALVGYIERADAEALHIGDKETYFAAKDVALRKGGTGSLGKLRAFILVEGPTPAIDDDVILDVKLQKEPAAFAYLSDDDKAATLAAVGSNQGLRMAMGQAAAQGPDFETFTGWMSIVGDDGIPIYYSVQARAPFEATLEHATLLAPEELDSLAPQWGRVLATGHIRGATSESFAEAVARKIDAAGGVGAFVAAVQGLSGDYAAQTLADYAKFKAFVDAQWPAPPAVAATP